MNGAASTPRQKALFLANLARLRFVGAAAKAAGLDRGTPARWATKDTEFRQRFQRIFISCRMELVDTLEQVGYSEALGSPGRAPDPEKKDPGEPARRPNAGMIRFFLGSWNREVYGERRTLTHEGEVQLFLKDLLTDGTKAAGWSGVIEAEVVDESELDVPASPRLEGPADQSPDGGGGQGTP